MKEIQLLQGSDDVIFPKQRRGSVCVALHRHLVYLLFNKKKKLCLLREQLANEIEIILN